MLYVVYSVCAGDDGFATGGTYLNIRLCRVVILLHVASRWYKIP